MSDEAPKYRLCFCLNDEKETSVVKVNNPRHALAVIHDLCLRHLENHAITKDVYSLEIWKDGGWTTWKDENGISVEDMGFGLTINPR